MMIRWIAKVWKIGAVAAILASPCPGLAGEPELARLKRHVETLASPEFAGRRDEGAAKARTYLIEEFKKLGLQPLFGDSFTQNVTGQGPDDVLGVNLGARIVGSDPSVADKWVILGTHYDHLGRSGEVYFPGADDNASGVAMMLEVARTIAESPEKPRRSIAFVGFDLEERGPKGEFGLRGSQFFARHSPVALEKVALFVTADMIGRSLGGVLETTAFVLGSEHEPEVRPWISKAAEGKPVKLALLGSDMLVIDRSDYGPFRTRKIPYLFFTTGESPVYHTPNDIAATLDYPKLEAISRIIGGVIREALGGPVEPVWAALPDYPVAEALAVRDVLQTLLAHKEAFAIGAYQLSLMHQTIRAIDEIERRGTMTAAERTRISRTAQVIMFTVF
jgi:Peptidase family M28